MLEAVLVLALTTPPCVPYADLCVPDYIVRYLPPEPETIALDPSSVSLKATLEGLVAEHFPAWAVPAAVEVVGCETGYTYDPTEQNPSSGASGYFQHMPRYWEDRSAKAGWAGYSIFHPEANVAVAAWLWGQTGDWRHWSCKP